MCSPEPKILIRKPSAVASVLHWSINQPFHEFFHQSEFQFFFLYSKRFKIKIFILISSGASAKNKINSPKTAPPYQRSTNPVNPFFVIFPIFYIVSMYLSRFLHLHTTVNCLLRKGLRVILCPHTDERMSGKPLLAYH
jgi:hypothetical protein